MPSFPVTVSLPRHPSRRLFALSVGSATPGLIAPEVARPAFVKLDAAFAAAPIGTGDAAGLSLGALDAETSERFAVRGLRFVVRGTVEADHSGDIPHQDGDALIFADPPIDTGDDPG
jgi:hypothetical protein